MEYLLTTDAISKHYGIQKAVDNVTIHVKQGAIYGLIGRNGAGKTTLLKMISGLARPTSGGFTIFDQREKYGNLYRSRIGALIESTGYFPNLTAYENLKLKCLAIGVRDDKIIYKLLETVGLSDAGKKRVKNFSLGMKQRLGIALALVNSPDLVILDEPINGLDPQGIAEIRETIYRLNVEENITFIISSHILEELSKIATDYGILHKGTLLQELTKDEITEKCSERIEIKINYPELACPVLEKDGISHYKVHNDNTIYIFDHLNESGKIVSSLAENDIEVLSVTTTKMALEDYFLNITGGGKDA